MDFLSFLFGSGIAASVYMGTGAIFGRVLLSRLLSESQFHLIRQGKNFYIAAGPRREVLTVAEVPIYERELRRLSRSAVLKWPRLMLDLYRPVKEKLGEIRGTLMSKAIASQRNALGVELMKRNLDNHALMTYVYSAETDDAFAVLRKVIEEYDRTKRINLTDAQRRALEPKAPGSVALLYPQRKSIETKNQLLDPVEHTEGLPAGYIWRYSLQQTSLYEKFMVSIEDLSTGRHVVKDGFYTHIYNTKGQRRRQTKKLKKKLALLLEAKIDPETYKRRVLEDVI